MAISYKSWEDIYRIVKATSGGTVLTQVDNTAFDYFDDSAVVNDAIYFGKSFSGSVNPYYQRHPFVNLKLNVGTALSGSVSIVWEYTTSTRMTDATCWQPLKVVDGTQGFTQTGEQYVLFNLPVDIKDTYYGYTAPISSSTYWIRARLDSVTSITEGGANSTQIVQVEIPSIFVDGSEETPDSFEDIYLADLAGTLDLMPEMPCSTGMDVLDTMSAEMGSLKIDITLSGTSAGAGDTIDITGTDPEGDAISESIDVSGGDGTYTSALSYNGITNLDCTGWSDGTIKVIQNRWGAFGKYGEKNYGLYSYIHINSGKYLYDISYSLTCCSPPAMGAYINLAIGGHCTLGELSEMGFGKYGGTISCPIPAFLGDNTPFCTKNTCYLKMYGVNVYAKGYKMIVLGLFELYDCNFKDCGMLSGSYGGTIVRSDINSWQLQAPATIEGVRILSDTGGVYLYGSNSTLLNVDCNGTIRPGSGVSNVNNYLINSSYGALGIASSNVNYSLYVQFYFNLRVVDKDGDGIDGASVVIEDVSGSSIFDGTTDGNGDITQQTLNYQRWYYASGIQTQEYSPHTVTISATGYRTKVIKYTMDQKRVEVETLERPSEDILIKWEESTAGNLKGYNVYRSETSGSGYIKINDEIISSVTFYNDTPGQGTWYYVIKSVDLNDNESDTSAEITITI